MLYFFVNHHNHIFSKSFLQKRLLLFIALSALSLWTHKGGTKSFTLSSFIGLPYLRDQTQTENRTPRLLSTCFLREAHLEFY